MKKKIAIIGGGITGLTVAFYLKKANIPFHIFEKNEHLGGVIQTQVTDNFLYEKGPNSGMLSNIEVVDLIDLLKGSCVVEVGNAASKKRLIWKRDAWEALPSGIGSAIRTPLFSLKDKLGILIEPFRKRGTDPNENLATLVKRRLGQSFLDYAIDPFISGIYAGNPNYLVTKYALPKLYNLEKKYGSFIKGALAIRKTPKTAADKKITKEVFSFKGGLSQLVASLEERIGKESISLNQRNLTIAPNEKGYLVNNQLFSDVVSTVNAAAIPNLFPFISEQKMVYITNLEYAQVIELNIGFKNWKGIKLDAFGGLIPSKEQKNILGVLFMSTIFKNRAPKGGALFTVFVGGTQRKELFKNNDENIKKLVIKDFKSMMGITDFKPDLFELTRYPKAIAQYGISTKKRLEAIKTIEEKHKGIYLAGSIRDGVGIADRIKQATNLAKIISDKYN